MSDCNWCFIRLFKLLSFAQDLVGTLLEPSYYARLSSETALSETTHSEPQRVKLQPSPVVHLDLGVRHGSTKIPTQARRQTQALSQTRPKLGSSEAWPPHHFRPARQFRLVRELGRLESAMPKQPSTTLCATSCPQPLYRGAEKDAKVALLTGRATVAPTLDAAPSGSRQPRANDSAHPSSCNSLQRRLSLPWFERSDSARRAVNDGSSSGPKCMSRSSSRQRPACNGSLKL